MLITEVPLAGDSDPEGTLVMNMPTPMLLEIPRARISSVKMLATVPVPLPNLPGEERG